MGKLNLQLLKGIEEQEKAIDTSMTNNKISNTESGLLEETAKEEMQVKQQQSGSAKEDKSNGKKTQTNNKENGNKSGKNTSVKTGKSKNEITSNKPEKQPAELGELVTEITTDLPQEKNSKKKFINFDITDIDRYLTAVAGIHGKSKTKYLHDLVVADMKDHPEIEALIRN